MNNQNHIGIESLRSKIEHDKSHWAIKNGEVVWLDSNFKESQQSKYKRFCKVLKTLTSENHSMSKMPITYNYLNKKFEVTIPENFWMY